MIQAEDEKTSLGRRVLCILCLSVRFISAVAGLYTFDDTLILFDPKSCTRFVTEVTCKY